MYLTRKVTNGTKLLYNRNKFRKKASKKYTIMSKFKIFKVLRAKRLVIESLSTIKPCRKLHRLGCSAWRTSLAKAVLPLFSAQRSKHALVRLQTTTISTTRFGFHRLLSKTKRRKMKLYRRRYYNKFQQKNPFSLLEKFSCFWLIKKLKVRVFKKTRRRTNFKKRKIGNYRNFAVSANRRSNNKRRRSGVLVIKSGKWCLKIKKRDGRVIFRPLKLSDFLSANSGWRTRTTSSKFRIQKSNKPSKALRGLLRTRSEYDTYLLRKRKLYSYYLRIFKFMRWKFAHYRSIFKKYSISLYKYKGFTSLPEQFSWYYFSSNLAQAKASNIQAKFKDVIKYGLISNSRRIWKLNQFVFVNNTVPTSFYMKYINWQSNFQNRPMVYNWSKKYRIMFTNTSMSRIIPSVVYYSPGVYYKNTFILSRYNLRFNNLLSNYQHYFIR